MNPPRIGDTFQACCPSCSAEKPVAHVVRYTDKRKGKYHLDVLCLGSTCFRQSMGSFDELDKIFYVTWLDINPEDGRTKHHKTETIANTLHSQEWEDRFRDAPPMRGEAKEKFENEIVELLKTHEFDRKRNLEAKLAAMRPEYSAVNLSFLNQLRLAYPEFSGMVKQLRLHGKVKFGMHYGHHMFGKGRKVDHQSDESEHKAHHRLREHRVLPGPIQVTVAFYVPVADERDIDHFFQSVFPWTEIRTPFHRVSLTCTYGDRKRSAANFKLNDADVSLTVKPHRLELTARLDERNLALSLMKMILMGSVVARELTCTARQEHKLLLHRGQPHFPSTILIHNQLSHSEALWKTEFHNLHRSFHAFPEMNHQTKRSVSQRMIMSHTPHAVTFTDEEVTAHLERFQILFLREFIGALGSEDVYVPPSVLRAFAPRGSEIELLVGELTGLYEERLKKSALEREKVEKGRERILNQNNFFLSIMFLLFSIAQAVNEPLMNWAVAGLAGTFVSYLAWRAVRGSGKDKRG